MTVLALATGTASILQTILLNLPHTSTSTAISISLSLDTSDAVMAVALGALFIIGLVECFFGFTLFRITVAAVGFVVGGALTYWAMHDVLLVEWLGYSADDEWVQWLSIGVALVGAILIMLVAFIITVVGVFVLGTRGHDDHV